MKRIKYACLEQMIHFQLKEDLGRDLAVRAVREELTAYKNQLDRKQTKYKIEEEAEQADGSIILRIKRQYNDYNVGDYLD